MPKSLFLISLIFSASLLGLEHPFAQVGDSLSKVAESDSAAPAVEAAVPPLLPATLGPMESVMWSEKGLMRKVFDLDLNQAERERELQWRRSMLNSHQIGGFVTLACMLTTAVLGQMIINGDESLLDAKSVAASATIATYFSTAALSILTPPPLVRRPQWSTVSTHKLLGVIHFSGMVLTPILISQLNENGESIERRDRIRRYHQISGYATTAAFAAALLVVTF